MRTTIELSSRQHQALTVLATRRGLKGFSALVQEAVEAYLDTLVDDETELLLGLEGVLDDRDAAEVEERIAEMRKSWRTAS